MRSHSVRSFCFSAVGEAGVQVRRTLGPVGDWRQCSRNPAELSMCLMPLLSGNGDTLAAMACKLQKFTIPELLIKIGIVGYWLEPLEGAGQNQAVIRGKSSMKTVIQSALINQPARLVDNPDSVHRHPTNRIWIPRLLPLSEHVEKLRRAWPQGSKRHGSRS